MQSFRTKLKTNFYRAFGRNTTGVLLSVAKQIHVLNKIIKPELEDLDPRLRSGKYEIDDLIWTVIIMFFLRVGSRNAMNELREEEFVVSSFEKIFGLKLPHLDTCHSIMEKISPDELKTVLSKIVSYLVNNKLFSSAKNFDRISILVDGTGIGPVSPEEEDLIAKLEPPKKDPKDSMVSLFPVTKECDLNPTDRMNTSLWATGKTSRNGIRYFNRQLLMLRMVAPNGMSIIVDWEAINTEDGSTKEDCEQNATKRLLARFKKNFKRLQVILIADGLFANQTFIKLSEEYGFKYIFTLKDDSLKNTWREIKRIKGMEANSHQNQLFKPDYGKEKTQIVVPRIAGGSDDFQRDYEWINGLQHKGSSFSWCSLTEYVDDKNKFYFSIITNLSPNKENIFNLLHTARERALVEDGFNTMKNRGSGLKHKYSKKSDTAAMNYITLMSIADILANLVFLNDFVQRTYFRKSKHTIISTINSIKTKLQSYIDNGYIKLLRAYIPQKNTYTMAKII